MNPSTPNKAVRITAESQPVFDPATGRCWIYGAVGTRSLHWNHLSPAEYRHVADLCTHHHPDQPLRPAFAPEEDKLEALDAQQYYEDNRPEPPSSVPDRAVEENKPTRTVNVSDRLLDDVVTDAPSVPAVGGVREGDGRADSSVSSVLDCLNTLAHELEADPGYGFAALSDMRGETFVQKLARVRQAVESTEELRRLLAFVAERADFTGATQLEDDVNTALSGYVTEKTSLAQKNQRMESALREIMAYTDPVEDRAYAIAEGCLSHDKDALTPYLAPAQGADWKSLVDKSIAILTDNIVPGGISNSECINRLLNLLDGPEYRAVLAVHNLAPQPTGKQAEGVRYFLLERGESGASDVLHSFATPQERDVATIKAIFGEDLSTQDEAEQWDKYRFELNEMGHCDFEGDPGLEWFTAIALRSSNQTDKSL